MHLLLANFVPRVNILLTCSDWFATYVTDAQGNNNITNIQRCDSNPKKLTRANLTFEHNFQTDASHLLPGKGGSRGSILGE